MVMHYRRLTLFIALISVVLSSCQKSGVHLGIDFSKSPSWRYLLGVDINGSVVMKDSLQQFSSSLRTFLQGQPSERKNVVKFTVGGSRITSNFLSEPERMNLENQFEKLSLFFSPQDGAISAPDSQVIPVIDVQGWDLYRNFAKVLPVLPGKAVQQGDKWDRERQFPVNSNHGDAIGHLYQSFVMDSVKLLDNERHYAYISWLFSYQIEPTQKDSLANLDAFPLNGNGTGTAVLNLKRGVIESAHAEFEVPCDMKKGQKISWREAIHLELIK